MLKQSVMSGKLKGIPAYNTNTKSNEFCLRQKDTDTLALRSGHSTPITYNPMKHDTFVKLYGAVPVNTARYVALRPNRQIRAWGVK